MNSCKEVTLDLLKEVFEKIDKASKPHRNMVLYTGQVGAQMIDTAIRAESAKRMLQVLLDRDKVTLHEFTSITKMIDSSDSRDLNLALEIIRVKSEDYGTEQSN
jgi:hypothetical protein